MTITEIVKCLDARVLCGEEHLDQSVTSACCSDLMSDALAFIHENATLLTGITNAHVVRTASILDLKCVVFVRGKVPTPEVIEMAREAGLVTMTVNKPCSPVRGCCIRVGSGARLCAGPAGKRRRIKRCAQSMRF